MARHPRRTTIILTRMAGCILLLQAHSGWADYPTSVLDDRPLGYWKLNDPAPPSAANLGAVGSSWDGTYHGGGLGLSGPTELADGTRLEGMGFASGSYEVGGLNTHLSVDAPVLSDLAEFTMSGWVFPDPPPRKIAWESGGRMMSLNSGSHNPINCSFGRRGEANWNGTLTRCRIYPHRIGTTSRFLGMGTSCDST